MKKAIILGGTHDHIRLIEILKERGFYSILIDYLENPPAAAYADKHIRESTLDIKAILEIAKNEKPEILMTACIDQALFTMADVCEKVGLPCYISAQTALALTNKSYMKHKLSENGIPTSSFIVLQNTKNLPKIDLKFPLVVKPADANGSKGVTRVNLNRDLKQAIDIACSHSRSQCVLLEEFVDGDEFSVDVMVREFEPTIVLITKNIKMQQADTFTIIKNIYPATHAPQIIAEIREIAKKIISAYSIRNGPLLLQLIHSGLGLYVVEFSARLGGGSKHHLIKAVTGFDALKWFVDTCFSEFGDIHWQNKIDFAVLSYVYAENGKIKEFLNFEHLYKLGIIAEYYYYKTPGSWVNNHTSSADRVAGVLITATSEAELSVKAETVKSQIEVKDINGRNMLLRCML